MSCEASGSPLRPEESKEEEEERLPLSGAPDTRRRRPERRWILLRRLFSYFMKDRPEPPGEKQAVACG